MPLPSMEQATGGAEAMMSVVGEDGLPSVRFTDVEPVQRYVATFSVRNTGRAATRIRMQPPKTEAFALKYIPTGAVAPGLEVRGEVRFSIPERDDARDFCDAIIISSEHGTVRLPLLATRPAPLLRFDPLADLGTVVLNGSAQKTVRIVNAGTRDADFEIEIDAALPLRVSPQKGNIPCGGTAALSGARALRNEVDLVLDFEAKEAGAFRALARVKVAGQRDLILDVSAMVLEQRLELVGMEGILSNVDFGSCFFGKAASRHAALVNRGPHPVAYSIALEADGGAEDALNRQEYADEDDEGAATLGAIAQLLYPEDGAPPVAAITAAPAEGLVAPFSEVPVDLVFRPEAPAPRKGFACDASSVARVPRRHFAAKLRIDAPDIKQSFEVRARGRAVLPRVRTDHRVLRFGHCNVNERKDILLGVRSDSVLPIRFSFTKVANFDVTPRRGILQPHEDRPVVVSFLPQQLGAFRKALRLELEGGVETLTVGLLGSSEAIAPKAKRPGGLGATAADFKARYRYTKSRRASDPPEGPTAGADGSYRRQHPWKGVNMDTTMSWDDRTHTVAEHRSKFTFSLQDLERRAMHRDVYNAYLREQREQRTRRRDERATQHRSALAGRDLTDPNGVDLGMERGLPEPLPPLPRTADLADGADAAEGTARSRRPVDENKLVMKKFKPRPTTQAEVRDCASELTSAAVLRVRASHRVLDFGRVCLGSTCVKNFAVANELEHCVLVSLVDLGAELVASGPPSQVVPAGATAGFDIHFSCSAEQSYKRHFSWSINERQPMKVTVLAEVVPVEVRLGPFDADFSFAEASLEACVSRPLSLSNPGNAPAEFYWTAEGAFSVTPDRGVIDARGKLVVHVTWTPVPGAPNEETLVMRVPGGTDGRLPVRGALPDARLLFAEKELDFGTCCVGAQREAIVHVRNPGKVPAVFFVDEGHADASVRVEPMNARVPPGGSLELGVSLLAGAPLSLGGRSLGLRVRGGRPLRLALRGECVMPEVSIRNAAVTFGTAVAGAHWVERVSLSNASVVAACLEVDLAAHPDFSLSAGASGKGGAADELYAGGAGEGEAALLSASGSASGQEEASGVYFAEAGNRRKWCVTIKGGATLDLLVHFTPSAPARHHFILPAALRGVPGAPLLQVTISAEAVAPRLTIRELSCAFGDRIVSRDPARRSAYTKELSFANHTEDGVTWELDDARIMPPAGEQAAFYVSPRRGDLAPGESVSVRVTFSPQGAEGYSAALPVYIAAQPDRSRPYLTLELAGSGVHPTLAFSSERAVLPPVPLCTPSRCVVTVRNEGFEHIEIQHRLSRSCPVDLRVRFPSGNVLGPAAREVPMELEFVSESPVSFRTQLELHDGEGSSFVLPVVGLADNSVLSTQTFLQQYASAARADAASTTSGGEDGLAAPFAYLARSGEAVLLVDRRAEAALVVAEAPSLSQHTERAGGRGHATREAAGPTDAIESAPSDASSPAASAAARRWRPGAAKTPRATTLQSVMRLSADLENFGVDPSVPSAGITVQERRFLRLWLNARCPSVPLARFPEDILDSDGRLGIDLLEHICARHVPGKARRLRKRGSGGAGGTVDRAKVLLRGYAAMLRFLVDHGALLHGVSPEELLDLDEHLVARELGDLLTAAGDGTNGSGGTYASPRDGRLTPDKLDESRARWREEWKEACAEAWATVLFQTIRTFVLPGVTVAHLTSQPGVHLAPSRGAGGSRASARSGSGGGGDRETSGSNVYSDGEGVLLRWLSHHVNRTLGAVTQPRRVTTFDGDIFDGAALCHLLLSHVPTLGAPRGGASPAAAPAITGATTPLAGFVPITCAAELQDDEARRGNLERVLTALRDVRCAMGLELCDLLGASARCGLLLTLHLYFALPGLVPRSTIALEAALGAVCEKHVELSNPSSRAVTFAVTLEGSSEFQAAGGDVVEVPARGAVSYPVRVRPRFTRPQTGRLSFWKDGAPGSSVVFLLTSSVTGREAVAQVAVSTPIYEAAALSIEVKNPFAKACDLRISIEQRLAERLDASSLGPRDASRPKGVTSGGRRRSTDARRRLAEPFAFAIPEAEEPPFDASKEERARLEEAGAMREMARALGEPLHSAAEELHIDEGGSATLSLSALPFAPGVYDCQIVLLDKDAGEFSHRVLVTATLPKPQDALEMTLDLGELSGAAQRELKLPGRNGHLERACAALIDRLPGALRAKGRVALAALTAPPKVAVPYRLVLDSPFYSGPAEVRIFNEACGEKAGGSVVKRASVGAVGAAVPGETNSALLSFLPGEPGTYPVRAVVFSPGPLPDYRVVDIAAHVTAPRAETTLEFTAAARQRIVQTLPIANNDDEDWELAAALSPAAAGFSGPRTLKVPTGETASFELCYAPRWIGDSEASLVLRNSSNGDEFRYALKGVAGAPLAEGHVVVACTAREPAVHTLRVQNFRAQETVFDVESDLPHSDGPSQITVAGGGAADYGVRIVPQLGGSYAGSLRFTAPDGQYLWFTIEVNAASPSACGTISLSSTVRRAVSADIRLENPVEEPMAFAIALDGPGLLGDTAFVLGPRETKAYTLYYSPLLPGRATGSVSFMSERAGELWYELDLEASGAPPVALPRFSVAVGGSQTQEVSVENPLDREVSLSVHVENRRNFACDAPTLVVPAHGTAPLAVTYRPSSLSAEERGVVTLRHAEVGDWTYECVGTGLMPSVMAEHAVTAPAGQPVSSMFEFRNPFASHLMVDVLLRPGNGSEGADSGRGGGHKGGRAAAPPAADFSAMGALCGDAPVFSLLLRKSSGFVLPPFSTMQIPLQFRPAFIEEYRSHIEVRGQAGPLHLTWLYPLVGVGEAPTAARAMRVACRAKASVSPELELPLAGLQSLGGPEHFRVELEVPDEAPPLLARSVSVQGVRDTIASPEEPVVVRVNFAPGKPFTGEAEIVVARRTGGRWRFGLRVEATEPEPDDRIAVEGTPGATSSVRFPLVSPGDGFQPYHAYFTTDSADALAVQPTSGVLPPADQPGEVFTVSFAPEEYGKRQRGRLVIETEDTIFSYEVIGTHPGFEKPTNVRSRVDTRLDRSIAERLGKGRPRRR